MTAIAKRIVVSMFALVMAAAVSAMLTSAPASASEIKYVVNGIPVTNYDIQRRAAFLKLQHRGGGAKVATQDMIEQALRSAEMKRFGISIPDQQIDDAYARFAGSNKLKPSQMDQILQQTGVTKAHFREFMRVQMGWSQERDGTLSVTSALISAFVAFGWAFITGLVFVGAWVAVVL